MKKMLTANTRACRVDDNAFEQVRLLNRQYIDSEEYVNTSRDIFLNGLVCQVPES